MPSIELICIDQGDPIDCSSYSFSVEASRELISDRVHSSTFQKDFRGLKGCIYRVHEGTGRTAYELLKRDWYDENGDDNGIDDNVEFTTEHESNFIDLVKSLIQASPIGEIIFTSDYQFGPDEFKRFGTVSISEFLTLYREKEVRMNSLYRVKKC